MLVVEQRPGKHEPFAGAQDVALVPPTCREARSGSVLAGALPATPIWQRLNIVKIPFFP